MGKYSSSLSHGSILGVPPAHIADPSNGESTAVKLTREGRYKNHGPFTIIPDAALYPKAVEASDGNTIWMRHLSRVVARVGPVEERNSGIIHDYEIQLSMQDIGALLEAIANIDSEDDMPDRVELLAAWRPTLVRLLALSVGFRPPAKIV